MEEYRQMAINALENQKGDDLERAKLAFAGRTTEQMQENYGWSGKTCQALLDEYAQRNEKIDRAIEWLKRQ